MLKNILKSSIPFALIATTGAIADNNGSYAGASLTKVDYTTNYSPDKINLTALSVILGHKFNDNFSLESRIGTGLTSGDADRVYVYGETFNSEGLEVDLDYVINIFAKATFFADKAVSPYVMAGYTKGELTASVAGYSESDNESGLSFAAGLEHCGTSWCGALEYVKFLDEDTFEISGLSLTATYHY